MKNTRDIPLKIQNRGAGMVALIALSSTLEPWHPMLVHFLIQLLPMAWESSEGWPMALDPTLTWDTQKRILPLSFGLSKLFCSLQPFEE